MEVPIESVDDLADQTAIEYGTIHGGSSMTFFQVNTVGLLTNVGAGQSMGGGGRAEGSGVMGVLQITVSLLISSCLLNIYLRGLHGAPVPQNFPQNEVPGGFCMNINLSQVVVPEQLLVLEMILE